jgi:hypothetical protein
MAVVLEPHVAGELAEGTEMDTDEHPPAVHKLVYALDTADADDLIESFPVYLVSDALANELAASGFTGFRLADAEVVAGGAYLEAGEPLPPPSFRWLKVGRDSAADFSVRGDHLLVVSDRAYSALSRWKLKRCDVHRV